MIAGLLGGQFGDVLDLVIALLPRRHVSLELAASQYPVRRHRHVRHRVQRNYPGYSSLCGPGAHHSVDRRKETEQMGNDHHR
jgi:hypothetical protein